MTAAVVPAPTPEAERDRLAAATRRAFVAESAARQRDPHHFGLSSLGGCRRAAGYTLSRTPVSDPDLPVREGRAANLGTWEHAGLLPRLAEQLPGASVEVKVRLRVAGLDIPGSIDLDDPSTVVDLKTVGEWRLHGVRYASAATYHHLMQAGGYGLSRLQEGRAPTYLAWHYLDRANGDEEIIVRRFTNSLAVQVVDRVEELAQCAESPDDAPRDEPGPGLSFACDECPWLRRCWGPDAEPGTARVRRAHDDPEVEAALLEYIEARDAESAATRAKKAAEARFEGARYGEYGVVSYRRGRESVTDDPYAAVRKLRALGLDVPQKTKRGQLQVKLIKQKDGS
jgi:hypothetical protein